MNKTPKHLEQLWNDLLSREPQLISKTFKELDPTSQENVLTHLKLMVSEAGWQPEQRLSASAALKVLQENTDQD